MATSKATVESAAMAARVKELEKQLILSDQEHLDPQLRNAELEGRVAELEGMVHALFVNGHQLASQALELGAQLGESAEIVELVDDQRLEAEDEFVEVRQQLAPRDAMLVANHQQIFQLQAQLDQAQQQIGWLHETVIQLEDHLGHVLGQQVVQAAPPNPPPTEGDEENSGLDYEAPLLVGHKTQYRPPTSQKMQGKN